MRRAASMTRRCGLAAIAACLSLCATGAGAAVAEPQSLEYPVKANYLVRFAAFVQWPDETFAAPATPLNVCVLGADPFGSALDKAVAGQVINGHPVTARRVVHVDPTSDCHILYVGRGGQQSLREVETALAAVPVLVVTDSAWGPERGHVHFIRVDNRVRFYIDDGAARRAGLSISSRLLTLALSAKAGG